MFHSELEIFIAFVNESSHGLISAVTFLSRFTVSRSKIKICGYAEGLEPKCWSFIVLEFKKSLFFSPHVFHLRASDIRSVRADLSAHAYCHNLLLWIGTRGQLFFLKAGKYINTISIVLKGSKKSLLWHNKAEIHFNYKPYLKCKEITLCLSVSSVCEDWEP